MLVSEDITSASTAKKLAELVTTLPGCRPINESEEMESFCWAYPEDFGCPGANRLPDEYDGVGGVNVTADGVSVSEILKEDSFLQCIGEFLRDGLELYNMRLDKVFDDSRGQEVSVSASDRDSSWHLEMMYLGAEEAAQTIEISEVLSAIHKELESVEHVDNLTSFKENLAPEKIPGNFLTVLEFTRPEDLVRVFLRVITTQNIERLDYVEVACHFYGIPGAHTLFRMLQDSESGHCYFLLAEDPGIEHRFQSPRGLLAPQNAYLLANLGSFEIEGVNINVTFRYSGDQTQLALFQDAGVKRISASTRKEIKELFSNGLDLKFETSNLKDLIYSDRF